MGAKYGEKTEIPKIVFVGLEGLNGHQGIEETETDNCYNPHYKGVTLSGIVILVRLLHEANTPSPIPKTLSGIVMLVILSQPLNT